MIKPYRLVVFDWEGTIADTMGDYIQTINNLVSALHLETHPANVIKAHLGLGLNKAILKLYPDISAHQYEALLNALQRELLVKHTAPVLIPGAEALLRTLKQQGVLLALASNKGKNALMKAISASGLEGVFDCVRTCSDAPPKPCPQMLEDILDVLHVEPHATLMIGDTSNDMEMAQALGVDAIAIDIERDTEANLLAAGASMVFNDYVALSKYLLS